MWNTWTTCPFFRDMQLIRAWNWVLFAGLSVSFYFIARRNTLHLPCIRWHGIQSAFILVTRLIVHFSRIHEAALLFMLCSLCQIRLVWLQSSWVLDDDSCTVCRITLLGNNTLWQCCWCRRVTCYRFKMMLHNFLNLLMNENYSGLWRLLLKIIYNPVYYRILNNKTVLIYIQRGLPNLAEKFSSNVLKSNSWLSPRWNVKRTMMLHKF